MAAALHIADEQIQLERLKEGDQRAFNYLYEQHSLIIYRRLKKMVKIDTLADEFLQDVFVKLWEKRHLIDPEQSLKAYLHLIAQNLVFDFYRKLAREARLQEEVKHTISEFHNPIQEDFYFKETTGVLQKAINNLPAQQKLVFTLCKIEGKSYEEVGRDLGISTSTINGHIVKATKSVKAYMTDYHKVAFGLLIGIVINDLANKL
jgi:RNA polymerase sigma-70 factor (family 1)